VSPHRDQNNDHDVEDDADGWLVEADHRLARIEEDLQRLGE